MAHLSLADIKRKLDESERTYNQGQWKNALESLRAIVEQTSDDLASSRLIAKAFILRGLCHIDLNESEMAEKDFEKALELARNGRDKQLECESLARLAHRALSMTECKKALERLDEAETIADSIKDVRLQGIIHSRRGAVYTFSHKLDAAEREFREGVMALERSGDLRELSLAYNEFANNFVFKGEHSKAVEIYEKCKRVADKANYVPLMALSRMNLGQYLAETNKFKEALAELEGVLQMVQKVHDEKGIMDVYEAYGIIYAKMGEWQRSEDQFFVARTLAQKRKVPYEIGRVLYHIGRMYKWKGDNEKALRFLKDARAVAEKSGITQGVALILKEIMEVEAAILQQKKH